MLRAIFHQKLGLFDTQDKKIQQAFLIKRFDELINSFSVHHLDSKHILETCEGILNVLASLHVNHNIQAEKLVACYINIVNDPKLIELHTYSRKKILHIHFHYLQATECPVKAMFALNLQDTYELDYYSDEQMLALHQTIVSSIGVNNQLYSNLQSLIAKYYLRRVSTNQDALIDYANFLQYCALKDQDMPTIKRLNELLMRFFISPNLFPGWNISPPGSTHSINNTHVLIPLANFINALRANAIVFAYKHYLDELKYIARSIRTALISTHDESSIRSHLILSMEYFLVHKKTLTPDARATLDTISQLANDNELSIPANKALRECPRHDSINTLSQPAISACTNEPLTAQARDTIRRGMN